MKYASGTKWDMLYGSFSHTLDSKGRLVIPSKIREDLSSKLFVLKGYDGCLSVYPETAFDAYLEKLTTLPSELKTSRDVLRVALSSVVELEIDSKNRVQLPSALLSKYSITSKVVVVGMLDHLEIWNEDSWNCYLTQNEPEFEAKSEELLGKNNG